jgi:uncharacterized protein (TIRG00374 family)
VRRAVLRVAGLAVVLAVMVAVLKDRVPEPTDVLRALTTADPRWLALAIVSEAVSLGMFARLQRRLLKAFGVKITILRAGAITYSRSAIAISLPAGPALSAGFAFRQYRLSGASRSTATTVTVLSGLFSFLALAVLYVSGLLAAVAVPAVKAIGRNPDLTMIVLIIAVSMALLLSRLRSNQQAREGHERRRPGRVEALAARWPRLGSGLRQLTDTLATARAVPVRHWLLALATGVWNWLFELGCLFASTKAFGLELSIVELAAIYLGVQIVRQIPLTPGGIGMIEAALLTGMVSAGAGQNAAAAAVLLYRMLSCWLIIPIGLLAWTQLRSSHDRRPKTTAGRYAAVPAPRMPSEPSRLIPVRLTRSH